MAVTEFARPCFSQSFVYWVTFLKRPVDLDLQFTHRYTVSKLVFRSDYNTIQYNTIQYVLTYDFLFRLVLEQGQEAVVY
jgi:hypothetical protein